MFYLNAKDIDAKVNTEVTTIDGKTMPFRSKILFPAKPVH
jgi:hypothetical protein